MALLVRLPADDGDDDEATRRARDRSPAAGARAHRGAGGGARLGLPGGRRGALGFGLLAVVWVIASNVMALRRMGPRR